MPPIIATIVFVIGIIGLFWLIRDRKARPSHALWIPLVWLLITGSRPVSAWLNLGPTFDSPEKYLDGSPLDAAVWGFLMVAGLIVLATRQGRVAKFVQANGPI